MSYIDREKAEKAIRAYADIKHNNGENIIYINGILKAISVLDELPNADVAEVVRCKDCKYEYTDSFCQMWCRLHRNHEGERLVEENHFCSYGECKPQKEEA